MTNILLGTPNLEEHLLRSSIRAFALHPDGPLPPVLCKGAKKRLADLQAELDKLNQSSAWKKLNFEDFTCDPTIRLYGTLGYL